MFDAVGVTEARPRLAGPAEVADLGQARAAQDGVGDHRHPGLRRAAPPPGRHDSAGGEVGDVGWDGLGPARGGEKALVVAGTGGRHGGLAGCVLGGRRRKRSHQCVQLGQQAGGAALGEGVDRLGDRAVEDPVAAAGAGRSGQADAALVGVLHGLDVEAGQPGLQLAQQGLDLVEAGRGADGQRDQDVAAAVGGPVADQPGSAGRKPAPGPLDVGVDLVAAVRLAVEVQREQRGAPLGVEVHRGHQRRRLVGDPAGLQVLLGLRIEHLDAPAAGLGEFARQRFPDSRRLRGHHAAPAAEVGVLVMR